MKKHYPTQEHCIDLLEELVWNYTPTCPRCNSVKVNRFYKTMYRAKNGYRCRDCRKTYTVTDNTIFFYSKVPLVNWFTAIHILKTFKRVPTGPRLYQLINVHPNHNRHMKTKILKELEDDDSLSSRIYQHNRQYEPAWY